MENHNTILEELMGLSPAVANIGNQNVFSVPQDYFNSLSGNVISHIYVSALPKNIPFSNPPAEYFESLPAQVLRKIQNIEEDITENIDLNSLNKSVYSAPAGYFDALPEKILQLVKARQNALNGDVQKELEQISPLLNTIRKENVYTVPEGYFENINVTVSEKADKMPLGKVVSLQSRLRKAVTYAAAASIAAIVLFAQYQVFFNKNDNITGSNRIEYPNLDIQKELAILTDEEINNYLDAQSRVFINGNEPLDSEMLDIETFLNNASDEEILQYLRENAEPGEKIFNGI